jgi:hypothetical protein
LTLPGDSVSASGGMAWADREAGPGGLISLGWEVRTEAMFPPITPSANPGTGWLHGPGRTGP